MKVTGIRAEIVALPADEPLAGAAENPNGTRLIVPVEVETDDGAVGVGATYFGGALTGSLKRAVEELGALCVGEDPVRVEMVAAKLRAAAGSAGPGGIFNLAISAIRHRAVGSARQIDEPAIVESARWRSRPGPDLCQRRLDARAFARPGRAGCGDIERPRLARDEDAAGVAWGDDPS